MLCDGLGWETNKCMQSFCEGNLHFEEPEDWRKFVIRKMSFENGW
jgi:hypothetical protein